MKSLTDKILWAVGHYSKKLHCNSLAKRLCRPFLGCKMASEVRPLEEIWADGGESCLCKNNLATEPGYDLQIVVPAYNVEAYVEECVKSILHQHTRYSFKVVIVNDGSTDGTGRVLKQFSEDSRVTIITQENRGFSGARNRALEIIDARYLMFVDSDDILCPGAIETLMSRAEKLDADIMDGGYERFMGDKVLSVNRLPDSDDNRWISGFPWGKVYKACLWENVHFPEHYWFEDTVIYHVVLPMAKTVASVSDVVYRWRKNSTSITASYKHNYKSVDAFWVTRRVVLDREILGLDVDRDYGFIFLAQVRWNFQRCARLYDEELNVSLFCSIRDLYLEHISPAGVSGGSELETALTEGDYGKYKLCCLFD